MTKLTNTSRVVLITAPIKPHWLNRLQKLAPDLHSEQWLPHPVTAIPASSWQYARVLYQHKLCERITESTYFS